MLDRKYLLSDNKYMAKMGRPPKPAEQKQTRQLALRLTATEYAKLERAAKKAKLTISDYVRDELGLRGDK